MLTKTKFNCLLIVLICLVLSSCASRNSTAQSTETLCRPATVEDIQAVQGVLKSEIEITHAYLWQGESTTPGRFLGGAIDEDDVGVWAVRGDKVVPMSVQAIQISLDRGTLGLTKEDLRWDDKAVNGAAACALKSLGIY